MRCTYSRLPRCPSQNRIPHRSILHLSRHASTLTTNDRNIAALLSRDPDLDDALKPTRVIGTVRTIRNQKRRSFLQIGDGSTSRPLQALLEPQMAEGLGTGTVVALTGAWQRSPPGKEQESELKVEEVSIIGPTDAEKYPLQKKFHSTEFLRTIPHLRLRTPLNALIARLRSECDYQLASFFREKDFIRLQPPIITSSDCEGAGEVFTVSSNATAKGSGRACGIATQDSNTFFREPKYLTVSSQLHLEAYMNEHAKVWTLSPTFRAEKSDTPRHVSEFWMLEAEMRTQSLSDIMHTVEGMIKQLVEALRPSSVVQELVALKRRDGIEDTEDGHQLAGLISSRWEGLSERPWPRVTYFEAMKELTSAAQSGSVEFQYAPTWDNGLQLEHEKYIAKAFGQGSPVFVTHYPQKIKPFYMLPSDPSSYGDLNDEVTVACFDLLLPDGSEVVGGSQREHRLDQLQDAMQNLGLSQRRIGASQTAAETFPSAKSGNLDWYLDLRRYGSVPHGGFGMGFDRLLGYLTGVTSIKDVVPWPRYFGRCDC